MQIQANINVSKNKTNVERKSDRELVVTRTFNCAASILFDAWTKPELLARWWAPKSRHAKLFSCEGRSARRRKISLRVRSRRETKFAFSGTYTRVERSKCVERTQLFEQIPDDGEAVVKATFDEKSGKTTLILHQRYPSTEALDGALKSGMEDGMRETFEQLEELVAVLGKDAKS